MSKFVVVGAILGFLWTGVFLAVAVWIGVAWLRGTLVADAPEEMKI